MNSGLTFISSPAFKNTLAFTLSVPEIISTSIDFLLVLTKYSKLFCGLRYIGFPILNGL